MLYIKFQKGENKYGLRRKSERKKERDGMREQEQESD